MQMQDRILVVGHLKIKSLSISPHKKKSYCPAIVTLTLTLTFRHSPPFYTNFDRFTEDLLPD